MAFASRGTPSHVAGGEGGFRLGPTTGFVVHTDSEKRLNPPGDLLSGFEVQVH
jgi:hypothetical protein